jgi:hypothetical protein
LINIGEDGAVDDEEEVGGEAEEGGTLLLPSALRRSSLSEALMPLAVASDEGG